MVHWSDGASEPIVQGQSEPIVSRCETLKGYSVFIAKVREYEAEIAACSSGRPSQKLSDEEKRAAMKKAISWCIGQDILKEFLEFYQTEVELMLFNEWNLEDALVVEREEGIEEGIEKVAGTALSEGASVDFIHRITGLDIETIKNLSVSKQL